MVVNHVNREILIQSLFSLTIGTVCVLYFTQRWMVRSHTRQLKCISRAGIPTVIYSRMQVFPCFSLQISLENVYVLKRWKLLTKMWEDWIQEELARLDMCRVRVMVLFHQITNCVTRSLKYRRKAVQLLGCILLRALQVVKMAIIT